MSSILALLCTVSALTVSPGLEDLLGTSSLYSWTVPVLLNSPVRITRKGVPLVCCGEEPVPGWGSFDGVELKSPFEAGTWGGGEWELDFSTPPVPDSTYDTGIGLLENTASINRYSVYVRRPIPAGMKLDFSMDRDDTLRNQRIAIGLAAFETGGSAWQTSTNAHSLWLSWSPGPLTGRFSFNRLYKGGRQWELLAGLETQAGPLEVMAGAAGALSDDTLVYGEGHLRLETDLAGITFIGRADVEDTDGDVEIGGTLGLLTEVGPFSFQAGAVSTPGADMELAGVVEAGPCMATISTGPGGLSGGLQALILSGYGMGRAGAALRGDTIRFDGLLLPSLPWGSAGRVHAGFSWELTHEAASGNTYGTADARSMFTLDRFAFIFAVEDVLDDYRSYTFGITWGFSDLPPRRHDEDHEE